MNNICLISGRSNRSLAKKISDILEQPLDNTKLNSFSDGECDVKIGTSVRAKEVFVIQSTSSPANEHMMELLIILDTLKRSSANRINVIIPYFGYARQDRKVSSRVPISAKLMADLLTTAGTQHIICVDLHVGQIQGFFNTSCDNIYVFPTMSEYIRQEKRELSNICVISPDAGGVERARKFAKTLKNAPLAIIDKRREKAGVSEVMNIIGDVIGYDCILIDDIVDTAGTLCNAANALEKVGAKSVTAVCAHGVLSGKAIENIESSKLSKLIISDTIEQPKNVLECKKIEIVTIAPLLAEVIRRIKNGESLNGIFH